MLHLVNYIQYYVEQRKIAAELMLDQYAAFDTIDHKFFFDKFARLMGLAELL